MKRYLAMLVCFLQAFLVCGVCKQNISIYIYVYVRTHVYILCSQARFLGLPPSIVLDFEFQNIIQSIRPLIFKLLKNIFSKQFDQSTFITDKTKFYFRWNDSHGSKCCECVSNRNWSCYGYILSINIHLFLWFDWLKIQKNVHLFSI